MLALALAVDTHAVPLVPLAPKRVAYCERSALLRAACRRLVPRVRAAYESHLAVDPAEQDLRVDILNLEGGGEYLGEPKLNRPPRMAHLVIAGGEVERSAPVFEDLVHARRVRLRNGIDARAAHWVCFLRPRPVEAPDGKSLPRSVVPTRRNARESPRLPLGTDRRYVVSLHAWEPVAEAAVTLKAIVASTAAATRRR